MTFFCPQDREERAEEAQFLAEDKRFTEVNPLVDYEEERRATLNLEPVDKTASRTHWFNRSRSFGCQGTPTHPPASILADAAQGTITKGDGQKRWTVTWRREGAVRDQHLSNITSTSAVRLFDLLNKQQPGIVITIEEV